VIDANVSTAATPMPEDAPVTKTTGAVEPLIGLL
jgi:hypothetical protein